jgi:RepB plasmid partitioning protein
MAGMERELKKVQREYQLIEDSYGADILKHTLAKGYVGSLLNNVRLVRYLAKHHGEILSEFQNLVQAE